MKVVHTRSRITLVGRTKLAKLPDGFRVLLTNAGRPGDGGGEKRRWLKLKRDEVDDSGPRS
jgi:hypothetical protein